MHRAESRGQRAKGRGEGFEQEEEAGASSRTPRVKLLCPMRCILCSRLLTLCSLLLFLCGCSALSPPDDYYQEVLEMEEHGERIRGETGRQPDEIVLPEREPIAVEKPPAGELMPEEGQQEAEEVSVIERQEVEIQEQPPRREPIEKPTPPQTLISEPVAVGIASEVIKSALNNANLGVNVRTVELVNGRLVGGRNSVRVSFLSESLDVIDDKFVAICAVIYHLDSGKNTVDVVVGMAEDEHANLLAIVQSNMSYVIAWMTNEISRAEWFSEISKQVL